MFILNQIKIICYLVKKIFNYIFLERFIYYILYIFNLLRRCKEMPLHVPIPNAVLLSIREEEEEE